MLQVPATCTDMLSGLQALLLLAHTATNIHTKYSCGPAYVLQAELIKEKGFTDQQRALHELGLKAWWGGVIVDCSKA